MKINTVVQKAQLLIVNGETDKRNSSEKGGGVPISQTDDPVNISRLISHLNQMMTTDVNSQTGNNKVAMLKSRIDSGTYTVSGMTVASKMLGIGHLV